MIQGEPSPTTSSLVWGNATPEGFEETLAAEQKQSPTGRKAFGFLEAADVQRETGLRSPSPISRKRGRRGPGQGAGRACFCSAASVSSNPSGVAFPQTRLE